MSKQNSRGRPVDREKQQQQKSRIIDSALALLAEKSYARITIRELADHAQVNSAMISYYFANKEGLFVALLDQMAKQHFAQMQQVFRSENPIKTFICMMTSMLCENNSFARLVHDEFVAEHSTLNDAFIERFPKKMAMMLPKMILTHTEITDPIKAKYAAFSLISMIITPFVGESVRRQAWKISDEELNSPLWAEHVYAMFMQGCIETNKEKV